MYSLISPVSVFANRKCGDYARGGLKPQGGFCDIRLLLLPLAAIYLLWKAKVVGCKRIRDWLIPNANTIGGRKRTRSEIAKQYLELYRLRFLLLIQPAIWFIIHLKNRSQLHYLRFKVSWFVFFHNVIRGYLIQSDKSDTENHKSSSREKEPSQTVENQRKTDAK